MPIEVRDIKQDREIELDTRQKRIEELVAEIITVDGATNPPNRVNYTWVKFLIPPGGPKAVLNTTSVTVAGTPVVVQRVNGDRKSDRIVREYEGSTLPNLAESIAPYAIGEHRNSHQYPTEADKGNDAVLVYQPALQPLKTTGDGSTLTVITQQCVYLTEGVRQVFNGGSTDLTSYVPSTSTYIRRVLVYLDAAENHMEVLAGTAVPPTGVPIPYPSVPINCIASAYVTLTYGQTAVTTASHVEDARFFLEVQATAHGNLDADNGNRIHDPFSYKAAGTTAREALTFVTDDKYKMVVDTTNDQYFVVHDTATPDMQRLIVDDEMLGYVDNGTISTTTLTLGESYNVSLQLEDINGDNISGFYSMVAWVNDDATDPYINGSLLDGFDVTTGTDFGVPPSINDAYLVGVTDINGVFSIQIDATPPIGIDYFVWFRLPSGRILTSDAISMS